MSHLPILTPVSRFRPAQTSFPDRIKTPASIPHQPLPSLPILLPLLLSQHVRSTPMRTARPLPEPLLPLRPALEHLLHAQRRNGPENLLRIHELLRREELAKRGAVRPGRRDERVVAVRVLAVRSDVRQRNALRGRERRRLAVSRRDGVGGARSAGWPVAKWCLVVGGLTGSRSWRIRRFGEGDAAACKFGHVGVGMGRFRVLKLVLRCDGLDEHRLRRMCGTLAGEKAMLELVRFLER